MLTGVLRKWAVAAALLATAAAGPAVAQDAPRSTAELLPPLISPPAGERPQGIETWPAPRNVTAPEGLPTPNLTLPSAAPELLALPEAPTCAPGALEGPAAPPPAAPLSFWRRCVYRLQDCFLGFPEEFKEPPLGHSIH